MRFIQNRVVALLSSAVLFVTLSHAESNVTAVKRDMTESCGWGVVAA